MAGRKKNSKLLGNHQRSWVWGRNLVQEVLRGRTWLPVKLLLADSLDDRDRSEAEQIARESGCACEVVASDRIRQLCGASEHQGFAAKMPEFPYATFEDLVARGQQQTWLLCDGIQDAHNFGAMVRSADGFGISAIVIPERNQVGVTSQVARSSAGAVNHVPIARVESLAGAISELQTSGVRVVALSEKAERSIGECELGSSVGLVVGNEGRGVTSEVLAAVDELVGIPLDGSVSSLNAAVAAAVAMYELRRQCG